MKPTILRIKLLKLVYTRGGYAISGIAHEIAPRQGSKGWSRQSATRWGHAFISTLLKNDMIKKYDDNKMIKITNRGFEYLEAHGLIKEVL